MTYYYFTYSIYCSKKPFVSIYRQYCELVDSLSRQIVEHCVQVISTSILHDAESHYWQDPKDFYEVTLLYYIYIFFYRRFYCNQQKTKNTLHTYCE